jgi:hypothetical protein
MTSQDPSARLRPGRLLLATFLVPICSNVVFLFPAYYEVRHGIRDFATSLVMLPAVAAIFAWPGFLVFLVLGIPTLYLLHRLRRTGFLLCALFGALYTPLSFIVLDITQLSPQHKVLQSAPTLAVGDYILHAMACGRLPC